MSGRLTPKRAPTEPTPNRGLAAPANWRNARHPPCLVHGEHTGNVRVVIVLAGIEVGELFAVGVDHFEAAGQALNGPWRREAAVGHWL